MVLYPSKYGVYRRSHILGNNLSRYFSSFFKKRNSWFFIINDKLFMSIFLNKEHVTESSHQLMVFTLRCKYIWNRRSDGLKRIGVRIEAGRKMHKIAKHKSHQHHFLQIFCFGQSQCHLTVKRYLFL